MQVKFKDVEATIKLITNDKSMSTHKYFFAIAALDEEKKIVLVTLHSDTSGDSYFYNTLTNKFKEYLKDDIEGTLITFEEMKSGKLKIEAFLGEELFSFFLYDSKIDLARQDD